MSASNSQQASQQGSTAWQDDAGDIHYGYDPEASKGFALLVAGNYHGIIEDCPVKRKKGKDGKPDPSAVPFLALKVRVDPAPGKSKGRVLFENVSFSAEWKMAQLQDAIYGKAEKGERSLNPMEIQGAEVTFHVVQAKSNRTNNPDPSGLDNSIDRFYALEEVEGIELYDYSQEIDSAPAEGDDWGEAPLAAQPGDPGYGEAEADADADLKAEMESDGSDGDELPFEDEPEPVKPAARPATRAPAKPAARPAAKKTAAKTATRRR